MYHFVSVYCTIHVNFSKKWPGLLFIGLLKAFVVTCMWVKQLKRPVCVSKSGALIKHFILSKKSSSHFKILFMKISFNVFSVVAATLIATAITSCNKNVSSGSTTTGTSSTTASLSSSVIAVTASATSADTIYVMQQCGKGQQRDSIAAADLPVAITNYLDTSYPGNTFNKGFAVKDSTGTIANYVVIIFYNGKPVGLLFGADGTFLRVLEQREPGDLHDRGWHQGGRFCNRDSLHHDTVALTALPVAITTYFASNYSTDTLLKAFLTADSGYVVISANNGLYATLFTASGSFVKRLELPRPPGKPQPLAQADLPATVLSYLDATYPSYVFDKAFSLSAKGVLKGYVVLIDANNTKYAIAFDANGKFISAVPVW